MNKLFLLSCLVYVGMSGFCTLYTEEVALEVNKKGQVGVNIKGEEIRESVELHVRGRTHIDHILNFSPLEESPESAIEGDLYLSTEGKLMLYFESKWNVLAAPTPLPEESAFVAMFSLDEQSGVKAVDSSSNFHSASLLGGFSFSTHHFDGVLNGALSFDGSSHHIEVEDHDALSFGDGAEDVAFSLSCWFNSSSSTKTQGLISKANNVKSGEYYILLHGGKVYFRLVDEVKSSYLGVRSADSYVANTWNHLVVTYDGQGSTLAMKIYLNGEELNTVSSSSGTYGSMRNTNMPLFIGKRNVFFQGAIDEVQVDSHALSLMEINERFNVD